MITFLARHLIKDYKETTRPRVRQAYGILCGAVGIALNLLLFAAKLFAGIISHSIAITADAFNNLSDAGSSVVTLFGFKLAGQKPDPDHPFGHGRIEYISGLIVSFLILLMAFELFKTSVSKILHPEALSFSPVVALILLLSIAGKGYMAFYNRRIGRQIDSAAVRAAGTDSISDMASTAVVLIATVASHILNSFYDISISIDGYCGLLVALFIFLAGINAAKDTISPLLGQAPDPEFVRQIHDIVMSFEGIIGIHDLIVHNYGPGRILISLHAEVSAYEDILAMHDRIDLAEHALSNMLHCHAVIHLDPICTDDPETNRLKELTTSYLHQLSPELSLHDFRIVTGPTHTNIIFDVVTPFDFPLSDKELISRISDMIRAENPTYYTVIEIDKPYSSLKAGDNTAL